MTRTSRCSSTPTLPAIPSAFSWDRDSPPGPPGRPSVANPTAVGRLCLLEKCFGFLEGCHLAVHRLLHRLGHQDLLNALQFGVQREAQLRTLASRDESELTNWTRRTSGHLEAVAGRRVVRGDFEV